MLLLAQLLSRSHRRAALAAATALCLGLPVPARSQVTSQPRATLPPDTVLTGQSLQLAASIRAYFDAAERGDLAAMDSLVAGDGFTMVEGAGVNRGWADYRDHHLGPEMKEMTNFRYRPFEIEARTVGDIGWSTFRYALSADFRGRPMDQVGRGTAILERRGNRWVIRHLQTSSRPRRAGDPAMPK